ncbi:MAG: hypothetical protein GF330_07285 [Candidatus Eisenbacteria bacterium]|nr:hypothetical protein [Candidatus Eisenbacteria bacterium]
MRAAGSCGSMWAILVLGLMGMLGSACGAPAVAQCIDYHSYLHWVDGIDLRGFAEHVAVSGDLAILADDDLGLLLIDISDPGSPFVIGNESSIRQVSDLASDGDLAVVVGDTTRLTVVDVSDPAFPLILGTTDTLGQPFGVALQGTYCYVADYESGLLIYDLTFPESPMLVGVRSTPGDTYGVEVDGTWAFVAGGLEGFHLVDISNPQQPVIRGTVATGGIAWRLHRHGHDVYVGDRTGSLHAIDISFPATPRIRSSVDTPGGLWDIAVGESHAYIADGAQGVHAVNITNPDQLRSIGSTEIPGFAYGIGLSDGHAFVASGDGGFQVVHVSGQAQVAPVGSINTPSWANAVAVRRGVACTANGNSGVRLYDVSDPFEPQALGVTPMAYAAGVAMRGWHAYVVDDSRSVLSVVNVADSLHPWVEVELEIPGNARALELRDTLALVAAGNGGLQIVDITDFLAPEIIGSLEGVFAGDVAVHDQRAYLASLNAVRVVDISDPTAPTQLGALNLASASSCVAAVGDYLYVGTEYGGLQVVDATIPAALELVADVVSFGPVEDIVGAGTCVYFVDRGVDGAGLHVVDASAPSAPALVGRTGIPAGAASVAVYGSYVYTGETSGDAGLRIYRAQCGGVTPVWASDLVARPRAAGIALRWTVHAEGFRGFAIQRAVGRDAPPSAFAAHLWLEESGTLETPGSREIHDPAVEPGRWYRYRLRGHLAGGDVMPLGEVEARALPGERLWLQPAGANPLRGGGALRFRLARSGRVRLVVCDPTGRAVRMLLREQLAAGTYEVPWDGRDGRGRALPSGAYWALLHAGAEQACTRLLVIR